MKIIIKPKKITNKNFKKFGEVIFTKKIKPININNGYAKRFDNLCKINTSLKKRKYNHEYFFGKKKKIPIKYKNDGKTSIR